MPKLEIRHSAGLPISRELKDLLSRFFSENEIIKLERLGGRVLISLAAPYNAKGEDGGKTTEMNEELISRLRSIRDKPEQLKEALAVLSVKQLRELGKLVDHPFRNKSTRHEIVGEVVKYFHDEEVWRRIADAH